MWLFFVWTLIKYICTRVAITIINFYSKTYWARYIFRLYLRLWESTIVVARLFITRVAEILQKSSKVLFSFIYNKFITLDNRFFFRLYYYNILIYNYHWILNVVFLYYNLLIRRIKQQNDIWNISENQLFYWFYILTLSGFTCDNFSYVRTVCTLMYIGESSEEKYNKFYLLNSF